MNESLFVVFPYICLTVFVVGHLWRYRYDKFGWTTRSSQLYENRLLRIGSPLFHFGMLGVVAGHVEHARAGARREDEVIISHGAALEFDPPRLAVDPGRLHAEPEVDAVLVEQLLRPQRQPAEVHLPLEKGLGEGRALIRQVRLVG